MSIPTFSLSNLALASRTPTSERITAHPRQYLELWKPTTPEDLTGRVPPSTDQTDYFPTPAPVAWLSEGSDAISRVMLGNRRQQFASQTVAPLLNGLGSALLGRFSSTQSDYRQAFSQFSPSLGIGKQIGPNKFYYDENSVRSTTAVEAAKHAMQTDNQIKLSITTASGKEVDISIYFQRQKEEVTESLGVSIETDGELSQEEMSAIAGLAQGFEDALQGIGENLTSSAQKSPALIDFSGLLNFDPAVLSAIDLEVQSSPRFSGLQSLEFHANARERSFSMQGSNGDIALKVDLSRPEILGNQRQRQSAIDTYLRTIEAANTRGRGGEVLSDQFKNIFAQLQTLPADIGSDKGAVDTPIRSTFKAARNELLSGLADFQGSMIGEYWTGHGTSRLHLAGKIDYQLAQSTQLEGGSGESGVMKATQTVSAKLRSELVKSRDGMVLDTSTGNYDTYRIDDESSITIDFSLTANKLKTATVSRLINQLEHYEKISDHKTVETRNTPRHIADKQDLLTTGSLRKAAEPGLWRALVPILS